MPAVQLLVTDHVGLPHERKGLLVVMVKPLTADPRVQLGDLPGGSAVLLRPVPGALGERREVLPGGGQILTHRFHEARAVQGLTVALGEEVCHAHVDPDDAARRG
jgi:hypothetical protein